MRDSLGPPSIARGRPREGVPGDNNKAPPRSPRSESAASLKALGGAVIFMVNFIIFIILIMAIRHSAIPSDSGYKSLRHRGPDQAFVANIAQLLLERYGRRCRDARL